MYNLLKKYKKNIFVFLLKKSKRHKLNSETTLDIFIYRKRRPREAANNRNTIILLFFPMMEGFREDVPLTKRALCGLCWVVLGKEMVRAQMKGRKRKAMVRCVVRDCLLPKARPWAKQEKTG